jgi:DNA-binding NarL/FixJ family response regulator
MKLGASGYLTKKMCWENIVEAIQSVSNGEDYFCEKCSKKKNFSNATRDNSKLNKHSASLNSILTERN